jgi:hypothetical protein
MRIFAAGMIWLSLTTAIQADVILTATKVNDTLKKLERLSRDTAAQQGVARANSWFDLATAADQLTTLINDEIAAHGVQEQRLIDLAVKRSAELNVNISLNHDGRKYIYDNAGFKAYLQLAARGEHAERAQFKVIEGEFFGGAPPKNAALEAAAAKKRDFLAGYPKSTAAPEVHLMLSVDYRDLYLRAKTAGSAARQSRFSDATRRQLRALITAHPDAEQAEIAKRMLARFDELVLRR